MLNFQVFGTPATQGSARAFVQGGRATVVTKTVPLIEWRETVRMAAANAAGPDWVTRDEAAKVELTFWLPRPANRPKTIDVRPSHGRTDLDKYIRAALDGITNAGIWTDDSRVVRIVSDKFYAVPPSLSRIHRPEFHWAVPGMDVSIEWELTPGS